MKFIFLLSIFFVTTHLYAQSTADELIASSQTGASSTFFKISQTDLNKLITPGDYINNKEFAQRNGLPNFFNKVLKGKGTRLKVAYIGGSITRANGQYRNQSLAFIQSMFPEVSFLGINAGVSGTDADLGACRLSDQVLKYAPDLVFVEFAVNGGFPQGMEGIVRQIIKNNKQTDICFIYTITTQQFSFYQQNTMSLGIQLLEKIAEHYQIPSIHMGMEATDLERKGELVAKGNPKESTKPVFSTDGVHPSTIGGDLYAASIARAMLKMKANFTKPQDYKLPLALYPDNWEHAKMLAPEQVSFSADWQKIDISDGQFKNYRSWFPYIMSSEKAGEEISFKFKGTAFGLFDIGAPEVGHLEVFVDGKQVALEALRADRLFSIKEGNTVATLKRFNAYCNNRTRGQYFLIKMDEDKIHQVSFKIAQEKLDKRKILGAKQLSDINKNPEKYNHNTINIGKILLLGDLVL